MNAKPTPSVSITLEIPRMEAHALLRALGRAMNLSENNGDKLDVQRLGSLRECMLGALDGGVVAREVEE